MIKNGNKRIALTTLLVFLHKNGKWLEVDAQELYNFTVWVAQSPAVLKDEVVMGIEKFIKNHLIKLETKN
jgi:death-on-curing protein